MRLLLGIQDQDQDQDLDQDQDPEEALEEGSSSLEHGYSEDDLDDKPNITLILALTLIQT